MYFSTTLPLTTGFFTKKLLSPPLFPIIPNYLVFNSQKFLLKNAKKIFRRNEWEKIDRRNFYQYKLLTDKKGLKTQNPPYSRDNLREKEKILNKLLKPYNKLNFKEGFFLFFFFLFFYNFFITFSFFLKTFYYFFNF